MVMPRSRSSSMSSRNCADISRAETAPVASTRRERDGVAAVAPQLEDLQAAKLRVDDPVVPDSRARVVAELLDAVAPHVSGARRGDLYRDVRRHADERVREGRHA